MIINGNIVSIGLRTTYQGRAEVVYKTIFSDELQNAYDGDFPIDEARQIMRDHRAELAKFKQDSSGEKPCLSSK